jgi:hypothetical protein
MSPRERRLSLHKPFNRRSRDAPDTLSIRRASVSGYVQTPLRG